MQTIISVRYLRRLRDDVGIPPESRSVLAGDIYDVLSDHAAWLEERGFAERVPVYPEPAGTPEPILNAFVAQLEDKMQGPYQNKMIAPAEVQKPVEVKRKRGRPKGTKNKPK